MKLGVLLGIALCAAFLNPAHAQFRWVVVSAEVAAPRKIEADVRERAVRALTDLGETTVELPTRAVGTKVSDLARQQAVQLTRQAMVHAALGDNREAVMLADQVEALAAASLAEWNRDDMSAQALFDACLFALRAELAQGASERAQVRLSRCRYLVPEQQPRADVHPPPVLAFIEEQGSKLATAALSIRWLTAPCVARLQGRAMSRAELALIPGVYQLDLECPEQRATRAEQLEVATGSTLTVEVDATFERVRDGLSLVYRDAHERAALAFFHAQRLAQLTGAERALLIAADANGKVSVSALATDSGRILAHATATLTGLEPTIRDLIKPRAPAPVQSPPRSLAVPWAWGLSAGAVGALAGGTAAYVLASARARELARSSTYPFQLQDQYHRARALTYGLSAAAAMLGSSAVLLGFPQIQISERVHRRLLIGSLSAGLLLAAAGALQLARDERDPSSAVAPSPRPALAALLFAAAAPCLTWSVMGLSYRFR